MKHLDSFWHVLGYAGGFAAGTLVGVMIEGYLAYGLATVHIISRHGGVEIAEAMRERGFGVTEVPGYGRDGGVELVQSVVQRQHLGEISRIVERWDPDAFVTVEEPRILRGGNIVGRRKMNFPWRQDRGGREGS